MQPILNSIPSINTDRCNPSPYAFDIDQNSRMWRSIMDEDVIGCRDPRTGQFEYPLPFSENTLREFSLDAQGRIWFASPSNSKVGYFYLRN